MRKDYSAPVLTSQFVHSGGSGREDQEDKQVDYSHLDIIAEVERVIERRLIRHTRTSGKYHCACPFPDCTSKQDAFTVWDRPVLEERGDGRREVHFWCGRCNRTGSLISLIRQYREATTGEIVSWADAARELRIDPRTWHAMANNDQADVSNQRQNTTATRRRHQAEQQRKAEQAELTTLDALYHRARTWLAAGQVVMKDGRQITLDQAQDYLRARGYTLDQATQLRLAYVPTIQEVPELADLIPRSWRGRILFPLTGPQDASGYAGRTLWHWTPSMTADQHKQLLDTWNEQHPDKRIARYYKTHQPAYYGYEDTYRASILVIVEGEFDAASVCLALEGLSDLAVCAFGKNFQARLVPVNILHVVLALDIDHAGQSAIEKQVDALQARGVTVCVAIPPSGKDWNDCHLLSGLDAIRVEIMQACAVSPADVSNPEQSARSEQASLVRPAELHGYENGDICLMCGKQVEVTENSFYRCEDQTSMFYGDLFCASCWAHRSLLEKLEQNNMGGPPASEISDQADQSNQERAAFFALVHQVFKAWPEPYTIDEEEQEKRSTLIRNEHDQRGQFTEANYRCPRHRHPLRYSDKLGERYCDHVDCWGRYRLMSYGAARDYPALSGVIDPRDYLPDKSKAPLYYTDAGLPIYPTRPAISQQLIASGADAWHTYTTQSSYHNIDKAIKAIAKRRQIHEHRENTREMNKRNSNHG